MWPEEEEIDVWDFDDVDQALSDAAALENSSAARKKQRAPTKKAPAKKASAKKVTAKKASATKKAPAKKSMGKQLLYDLESESDSSEDIEEAERVRVRRTRPAKMPVVYALSDSSSEDVDSD